MARSEMAGSLKKSDLLRYARYTLYALAGAALLWFTRGSSGPRAGAEAPSIDLPVVAAEAREPGRWSLATHQGKPVLIEVFASWCGTCRKSAPELARAHSKYKDDLEFLGVSVDSDLEAATRAKQNWQIPYTVAYDDGGAFARAYRIRVLPTFVLLKSDGHIVEVSSGMPSPERLDEWARSVTQ